MKIAVSVDVFQIPDYAYFVVEDRPKVIADITDVLKAT